MSANSITDSQKDSVSFNSENEVASRVLQISQEETKTTENNNNQLYHDIIKKYGISEFFAPRLKILNSFKIVFLFDDSDSMNTVLNDSPLNTENSKATRWDELQYFSKISIEIANVFNQNGTDVYFLNRPMARNVKSPEELIPHFKDKPYGYTPLTKILKHILQENELNDRKLLIIITTDGKPTDDYGKVDKKSFKNVLKSRNTNTYTTIVCCTDEDNTMDYLNDWDRTIPRLDVVDDYRNEKLEIQKVMGEDFSFTFGDYVLKSIIGSIDSDLDNLDESKSMCSLS